MSGQMCELVDMYICMGNVQRRTAQAGIARATDAHCDWACAIVTKLMRAEKQTISLMMGVRMFRKVDESRVWGELLGDWLAITVRWSGRTYIEVRMTIKEYNEESDLRYPNLFRIAQ